MKSFDHVLCSEKFEVFTIKASTMKLDTVRNFLLFSTLFSAIFVGEGNAIGCGSFNGEPVQMLDCGCPGSEACLEEHERRNRARMQESIYIENRIAAAKAIADRYPGFDHFIAEAGMRRNTVATRVVQSMDYSHYVMTVIAEPLADRNGVISPVATVDIWKTAGFTGNNVDYALDVSRERFEVSINSLDRIKIGDFSTTMVVVFKIEGVRCNFDTRNQWPCNGVGGSISF